MKNIVKNKKTIIVALAVVGIILIFFIFKFNDAEKIKPEKIESVLQSEPKLKPLKTGSASVQTITEYYDAVGTVRPRSEASIEAQITAQVLDVKVKHGNKVLKNQILITLDNRQFLSRLDQAKQGLQTAIAGKEQANQAIFAAKALFDEAESAFKRTKKCFETQVTTSRNLEQAESAYLQASAGLKKAKKALGGAESKVKQAKEVIQEAKIALGYTTIKAPANGEVLRRFVEPGDLALPGKPLIVLQTAGSLRLEAYVREGLIKKVRPTALLKVELSALNKTVDADVDEIIPYADPETRTFLVKVSLPHIQGLYPGMYGKLLIPITERQVVLAPVVAVRKIGQLELVTVKEKNIWRKRFVKTGKKSGDKIEILSGLSGNEIIVLED